MMTEERCSKMGQELGEMESKQRDLVEQNESLVVARRQRELLARNSLLRASQDEGGG